MTLKGLHDKNSNNSDDILSVYVIVQICWLVWKYLKTVFIYLIFIYNYIYLLITVSHDGNQTKTNES